MYWILSMRHSTYLCLLWTGSWIILVPFVFLILLPSAQHSALAEILVYCRAESVEWFIEDQAQEALKRSCVTPPPAPPILPSRSRLSFYFFPVWPVELTDRIGRGRGGSGAWSSYKREKEIWSYIYHSLLFGQGSSSSHTPFLKVTV